MTDLDTRSFVTRALALVGSSPPTTARETRTWLVEPFLEALGWSLRDEGCRTDRTLEDARLEYVLAVDSIPAVLVAVEPCPDALDESRVPGLLEAMTWTGVDRAIYTNGREYLLLAGTTDAEQLACRLPSLPDHESSLQHYSRATARDRLEHGSREAVSRQLAVDRMAIRDGIVDQLTAATGTERYADEFEAGVERLLDQFVVSFTDEDRDAAVDREGISLEYTGPSLSTDELGLDDGDRTETSTVEPRQTESDSTPDVNSELADGDRPASDRDDDGEYVVRFFTDRGSIGAIGHSSATQALVQATEYCLERGLAGVSVPWSPSEEDGETVLNDEPVRADGSSMESPQQLSNGYYLETAGSVDDQADRVEALASRAGLRAMLTGDWES
ncbi:hypothetical protein CV102_15255 [Natronococcus pandeyae]|uniref:Type I restriction enzyme R protein N-terminal domain-containing protein n=1 Tax=Natronococcus pandeyae TaxID=2055836 RepID=A0A8J8Q353_9EURY|nr:hypothetical protein [Natronococcus pandeyae]TYL37693.1 hypothetical protein CV102_15255 [Natronococcus pandeyae]